MFGCGVVNPDKYAFESFSTDLIEAPTVSVCGLIAIALIIKKNSNNNTVYYFSIFYNHRVIIK